MARFEFDSPEFDAAVKEATHRAFLETLAAGLSVFYRDKDGLNVMEQPDGRRFEIEWVPGAPAGKNYRVIREVTARDNSLISRDENGSSTRMWSLVN